MFEEQARDVELMLQKRLRTQCDLPIYFSTASRDLPISPEPYDKVDPPVRVSTSQAARRARCEDATGKMAAYKKPPA
jgi:hypothetical protein